MSIAPSVIKQYASNIEKIKDYSPEKCIGCGLCTFVCPAKINLRDIIQNAKKEVTK